ncbi:MAG: type II secretion system protein N [Halioglobus sp.]
MARFTWAIALAVLLLVSLVVSAPARLLGLFIPGQQVLMQGYSGTVWRGSASRALVQIGPGYLHLGAVQWSLDPFSILLLAPRLTLNSAWGDQLIAGEVVLRGQRDIDLHEFEAAVSADLLRQFIPVALTGTLSAQLQDLQLRDGLPHSGAGRLVWQNGGWQSPQGLMPLGTYALDFQQAPGDLLQAQVVTVSGPLDASGTAQLQGKNYAVDVQVSSQLPMDARLEQALSLIAAPESGGYRVKLDGDL